MIYASTNQILQQLPKGDHWLTLTVELVKAIADAIGVDAATLPPQAVLRIAERRLSAAQSAKVIKSKPEPANASTGR